MRYDVVVCGLGAMGSAALHALARKGKRVLGLERYAPGHDRGSSHGLTRLIRLGYFEHPGYVPLLLRAYALWRELEAAAGRRLLHVTGIAEIGSPASTLVRGTLASSRLNGLRHEVLTAPELMRRHPAFELPPDYVAVIQPDGGYLEVEPSIAAQFALAAAAGADIRNGTTVRAIEPGAHSVRIVTDGGSFEAGAAIVTVGAWTTFARPGARPRVASDPRGDGLVRPDGCRPVLGMPGVHHREPARHALRGSPLRWSGVKVAKHHHRDEAVEPDSYDRTVSADDEALIRAGIADHIPAANGPLVAAKTCLYTMTPDGDFLIDRLPSSSNVIVASPCSGHGFKFAPVIGEILADLATDGTTRHDISRFRLDRFR